MKDIPGYEGLYSITSCGKVWSWKRQKFLKPRKLGGYLRVHLTDEAGNIKDWFIHRLVAITYIPNPEKLPLINHKDENKTNNCVQNLEWCTAQYNVNYSKYKIFRPIKCLETGEVFESITEAAKKLNLHSSNISAVLAGKLSHTGHLTFRYVYDELKTNI